MKARMSNARYLTKEEQRYKARKLIKKYKKLYEAEFEPALSFSLSISSIRSVD